MLDTFLENRLRELTNTFVEENKKLNLSAFRTEELCWNGNVLDSLPFTDILPKLRPISTLLDMGTGGGFPLLALALALPQIQCTGLDATQKKVDAVKRMIETLNISNATCIAGRSEELGRDPKFREQYDVVTSRAVAEIPVLLEYCSPFVKPQGYVVLWKSVHAEKELQDSLLARAEMSCHLIDTYEYELPGDWGKRQLLIFEKAGPLSKKYPRPVGIPKKDPIL